MSKSIATDRELWKKFYQLYMVEHLPVDHIAERLGYSDDTVVESIRRKFGCPARRRADLYTKEALMMFSPEQEQILLGSILGDGCIMNRDSRNPIYTESHSIHQIDYLSWKQTRMYPFMKELEIGHKQVSVMMRSRALPQLGFYRGVYYPDDKKVIPVETLEWMDDLAVAVWFMDDGTCSKGQNQFRFSTCGFDMRTNGMLQGWFAAKYGLYFYVVSMFNKDYGKPYLNLVLQAQCNKRFVEIIEPHIVPSMRYKLGKVI
jgi:recombination protein RecA